MKIGNLYATKSIDLLMQESSHFRDDINTALNKYIHNDWGETCPEDVKANNEALKHGGRIIAAYETYKGRVWMITDEYRSSTTILFPSEY